MKPKTRGTYFIEMGTWKKTRIQGEMWGKRGVRHMGEMGGRANKTNAWFELAEGLEEEVREGGAEEGAVNVVAPGDVVVVDLPAARAIELERVLAAVRGAVGDAHRQDRLLVAERARARTELVSLGVGRGRGGGA